jgi:peptidoglycan/LPS O-acetylase OafA/YrhL
MFCKDTSPAFKRYQRRVLKVMAVYFVVILLAAWVVRHEHPHGWPLYFWSALPAVPVILVIVAMGLYVSEEKDEYLRMRTMLALLVSTGALLGTLVVSDFLQSFAGAPAFPPFTSFVIFAFTFAATQGVLKLRNRASDE